MKTYRPQIVLRKLGSLLGVGQRIRIPFDFGDGSARQWLVFEALDECAEHVLHLECVFLRADLERD